MSRRLRWTGIAVACFLALAARADDTPAPAPAEPPAPAAASQIGRSIFVVNDVDGKAGEAPPQRIAVNDDIVFEEDITTGADSKTVVEFRDGSTFEVGPDAVVRIDSFVFNPEESTSHKAIEVTRGVFRYVSGYVASNQETNIQTPTGAVGVRGSVAAGLVDPAVPDFIYLGEGSATFTNAAGRTDLQPGNSIAVPSAATPPMAPGAMPAPVAAQVLQAIEKRLPPPAALANRPAADEAWLKRAGAADLVPVAEQQRVAAAAATRPPLPRPARPGALAGELGLLAEGNRVGLFAGRQATRTAEQTAFLARTARENPNAAATMRRFGAEAHAMHGAAVTAGTALVIRGVGHAAPSPEVMRRVTTASVRANPGAAALITRHAAESYRGAAPGGLSRPGNPVGARPGAPISPVHEPNPQQRRTITPPGQPRPQVQPPPRNFAPKLPSRPPIQPLAKQPPKPPAKGTPPKKKGEDQNPNQNPR